MSAASHFDVVRSHDPALCKYHEDGKLIATYALERDFSKLSFPDDADPKPVIFRCRKLSRSQRRQVDEIPTDRGKAERAFKYGCVAVSNLRDEGGAYHHHEFQRQHESHAIEDDVLDRLEERYGLGDEDILDIGRAVVQRSFLAMGVPRNCALSDFSREAALAQIYKFHAEPSKDSETPKAKSRRRSAKSKGAPKARQRATKKS